ncbi:hypothetical protein Slin15195_G115070 [Septoria linicola]|uniref:Uncharacterized protein n=1 Tax=Septoria linicola TaxID=215465 RepID=A0A9Q9ER42_9PEZI|nr:hypothetical protein Slin15195_G115070 [Septoria linicola]
MFLSDTLIYTWLSIRPLEKNALFERIDVKVRPAVLDFYLDIASKIYLEAMAMSEPPPSDFGPAQARLFEPTNFFPTDRDLIVSPIGWFCEYGNRLWDGPFSR